MDNACELSNIQTNTGIWLRSCKNEVLEPIVGKVSGEIPRWLNGALIQNGGGLWEIGNSSFNHLFDCMALLQKYEIQDGRVTYQCRFLESETYKRNLNSNSIVVSDFGTVVDPDSSEGILSRIFHSFSRIYNTSDNAAISVYSFGDELYCFAEFPYIYKIDKSTLKTDIRRDFKKMGVVYQSSHPHVTKDGTVYNLATTVTKCGLYHNIICFPNEINSKVKNNSSMFDKARVVASIPARWTLSPSYMHTFGITNNFFIIVEQPINIYIPRMLVNRVLNRPVINAIRSYNNELTKINILGRLTGKLGYEFYSKDFFYYHIINSYECDRHIILDVCCTKGASIIDCLYKDSLKNAKNNPNFTDMFQSRPFRYVLPLIHSFKNVPFKENLVKLPNTEAEAYFQPDGKVIVKPEPLCDFNCETPTINYDNYSGKVYRYFYAMSLNADAGNSGTLIKVDTTTKAIKRWYKDDYFPTEPIFVPSPNAQDEDDGVVLTACLNVLNEKEVSLVTLDAKTFTEISTTTFVTPSSVPKAFHGSFFKS